MIRVRFKNQPNEVREFVSRKEILDMERWGLVLEVVHDDEAPGDGAARVTNDTGKPEKVLTEEQLKRVKRKASPESASGDEQE